MDTRFIELSNWLRDDLNLSVSRIVPASADASFRRYFRVRAEGETSIVMDAPPDKEDCVPFVRIARALYDMGLNVPHIQQQNFDAGFLLLSDLGETNYLSSLNGESADQLYHDAIDALLQLQQGGSKSNLALPAYDKKLFMAEMELFRQWLVGQHLGFNLSDGEESMLTSIFELLAESALAQPQTWVHRDYHSRNLMVCANNNPGILDFQDAVRGPMSYDLVSLLRDCYIEWPLARQQQWLAYYCDGAQACGLLKNNERDNFMRWFDLMGVQRHLKAAGIFARLSHRDGKEGYLGDVPRTLGYICRLEGYPVLQPLIDFINRRVLPKLIVC